jgi:metal-responsive CopG/Arc/MetJ family transcriptional regulator
MVFHRRVTDDRHEAENEVMFGSKVKLDRHLLEKVKRYAELAGYSSPEEFITHALEKEIAKLEEADSEEEIRKRLQGLGYIS